MDDSLADVAFLASSPNRIRALDALADGPYDRDELQDALGISRVTAKRILDDFETRGWIVRDEHAYRTTPLGDVIATEFGDLLDTMATMRKLSTVHPWLPDDFDVDLRQLADARITLPTSSDSVAPVRRSAELMSKADAVRGLASGIAPEALRINRDCVVEDGQSFEVVFSTDVLDVIRADSTMARWLREILDAGGQVYSSESIDRLLAEFDNRTVAVGLTDETGVPRALVESESEVMCEWFRSIFEFYRDEAEPVNSEALS